jgi:hypothetical protein
MEQISDLLWTFDPGPRDPRVKLFFPSRPMNEQVDHQDPYAFYKPMRSFSQESVCLD